MLHLQHLIPLIPFFILGWVLFKSQPIRGRYSVVSSYKPVLTQEYLDLQHQERIKKLAPFKLKIEQIANTFSDDRAYLGAGMGMKPSNRTFVRLWLEKYIVAHGSLPDGKHDIQVPFFYVQLKLGTVDFSSFK